MTFRPDLIVSGGQTGADQGALLAAKVLGIRTGGYAPKGWRTEAGPAPWLADYGLVEHISSDYVARTADNIRLGDATIIFGRPSPGSSKTLKLCQVDGKPVIWITANRLGETIRLGLWLTRHRPKTLNVAGNRESVTPGIRDLVRDFLVKALS